MTDKPNVRFEPRMLIDTYLEKRNDDERFVDTVHRIGIVPFKERVYAGAKEVAHG